MPSEPPNASAAPPDTTSRSPYAGSPNDYATRPDPSAPTHGEPGRGELRCFWRETGLDPSTTWLLRRLAAGLEAEPDGFELELLATAQSLGLGGRGGRNSPFMRALERSRQFSLTRDIGGGQLAVRRKLPPLNRHQVARLPRALQERHQAWQDDALAHPAADEQRRRARRLALSLFELGEDRESAERQLHRWRFHPALSHQAVEWAWDRHRVAQKAAARQHEAWAAADGSDAA